MGNLIPKKNGEEQCRKIYPSTSTNSNFEKYKYANNEVRTQKYNAITFIPINLFEQFHRFANIYFVFILILNFLPEIEAFGKEVAPIPVVFVLSVTAIKDAVEDYRRFKADQRVNHSKCLIYSPAKKQFVEQKWSSARCGDFVKLHANETIPADIVLLHSNDISGICHIETSNLDGESNLKQREVVMMENNNTFKPEMLSNSFIEVENPNQEIYKFNGTIFFKSQSIGITLRKNNLLLRGCTLRNTEEVIGIVVYAGKETKAMLNNNDTRFKRSKLERQINKDVIWCVLLLIILCLSCSIGNVIWTVTSFTQDFIEYYKFPDSIPTVIRNPAMQAFLAFWTSVIYYQALIPLPLYVTFEFVKMHQVFHIRKDLEMYDNEAEKGLEVRAFNIPEDLGQIQYVFCDKTGTLTENRMEFKRAFIDGDDYAVKDDETDGQSDKVTMRSEFGDTDDKKMNDDHGKKLLKNLIPMLHGDIEIKEEEMSRMKNVKDFFLLMGICNTTVVSLNKNEKHPYFPSRGNGLLSNKVIKTKKFDLRKQLKKRLLLAGEGVMNKAASISSFSAKNIFTKSGKVSMKNSDNTEIESKVHDVLFDRNDHSLELLNFKRNDSALPDFDDIHIRITDTNQKDYVQTPNKSRKVKSVLDFRSGDNMYADTESIDNINQTDLKTNKKSVHIELSYIADTYSDINTEGQKTVGYNCIRFKSDIEGMIPANNNEPSSKSLSGSYNCLQSSNILSNLLPPDSLCDRNNSGIDSFKNDQDNKCPISDKDLLASYESESPDEMALVKTACIHGYKLLQRGPNFVTIWNPESERPMTYTVLQVLPFDSNRKRMSIIVKCPQTDNIIMFCKGADSAMFGNFSKDISEIDQENTKDYMDAYARMGLRILVMGQRVISKDYFSEWHKRYKEAEQKLGNNEKELLSLTSEIESDMMLLGVSGIEDCLQDGVADTIESLRRAGITVWILTGDKRETAINIAYSAKLFSENQRLIELSASSKEKTHDLIKEFLGNIKSNYPNEIMEIRQGKTRPLIRKDLALSVDGSTLTFAMEDEIKMDFLHLAEQCCSVVCARTTPIQKAEIVQLVKENLRMQTLAIGDGANDVSMIQMADVGVGIGGNEGMQAVMASDFAMTKFKYLKRLLLVHGSWCYNKLARTALYMFYKDTIYILLMFWFQFCNAFSASMMIDPLTQVLFNITMTGLPPIIYGVWDKDLHADTLMRNPELYRNGINCKSYKPWHFWVNILDAIWQSSVIYVICYITFMSSDIGIWEFGQIITACALITCLVHLGIETRFWTWFHGLGIFISFILAWLVFTMIYTVICGKVVCGSDDPYDFIFQNMQRWLFWLLCVVTPLAAIFPRLTINTIRNSLYPNLLYKGLIREEKLGKGSNLYFDYEPELVDVRNPSTIIGSVLGRPSIVDLTKISSEYGIPNTPVRSGSSKPQLLAQKSCGSFSKTHQNFSKHKRVKSYDENKCNHCNNHLVIDQPNVSPIHHEVTSFLTGNRHSQSQCDAHGLQSSAASPVIAAIPTSSLSIDNDGFISQI